MSTEKMKEIKVQMKPSDIARLNAEANALGIHRGTLVRQRALQGSSVPSNSAYRHGREVYAECIEAASKVAPGISRPQLEAIVSRAIATLAKPN